MFEVEWCVWALFWRRKFKGKLLERWKHHEVHKSVCTLVDEQQLGSVYIGIHRSIVWPRPPNNSVVSHENKPSSYSAFNDKVTPGGSSYIEKTPATNWSLQAWASESDVITCHILKAKSEEIKLKLVLLRHCLTKLQARSSPRKCSLQEQVWVEKRS